MAILRLAVLGMAIAGVAAWGDCVDGQYDILMDLYNSTNGPKWFKNTGWGQNNQCCQWYGMDCNCRIDKSHCVLAKIRLGQNGLKGRIPESIGKLGPVLNWLWLGENEITGTLPHTIGNLTNLQSLDVSYNQLNGSIPPVFGNLSNLDLVDMSHNQLTGGVPGCFGKPPYLTYLYLQDNSLSGPVPEEFTQAQSLKGLFLFNNNLTGFPSDMKEPEGVGNGCLLEGNQFKCPIPAWTKTSCKATCT